MLGTMLAFWREGRLLGVWENQCQWRGRKVLRTLGGSSGEVIL